MFAIIVLAILAAAAVPSMTAFIEKNRLRGAAEALFTDLVYARSEALKRNREVSVIFQNIGASDWCYGAKVKNGTDCDCTIADPNDSNACVMSEKADNSGPKVLKTTLAASYPQVTVATSTFSSNKATFTATRGTANGGTVTLQSDSGKMVQVRVSSLGRVMICSPSGAGKLNSYPDCPS